MAGTYSQRAPHRGCMLIIGAVSAGPPGKNNATLTPNIEPCSRCLVIASPRDVLHCTIGAPNAAIRQFCNAVNIRGKTLRDLGGFTTQCSVPFVIRLRGNQVDTSDSPPNHSGEQGDPVRL